MCMGPPRCLMLQPHRLWVYPHVYGATLPVVMAPASILGLSPCVWGHPQTDRFQPIDPGSIPMCMGPLELPRFHGQFLDRKSTRLNSSHVAISYAVFCLKKKKQGSAKTRHD